MTLLQLLMSVFWFFAPVQSVTPSPVTEDEPVVIAERLSVEVLNTYAHQPDAFTQGLLLYEGLLYESTGRYGQSSLRQVDIETGVPQLGLRLPAEYFAEGLERVDDRLIQITWREQIALVYNLSAFTEGEELTVDYFIYEGEGWGLCYDAEQLYMTDGSDTVFIRDPQTFEVLGEIPVTLDGQPLAMLNELECVDDTIYANVWMTDYIVQIDKETGVILALIDAAGLLTDEERATADVLNGIAYNPETETFYITGKLWPHLFEVNFVPADLAESDD